MQNSKNSQFDPLIKRWHDFSQVYSAMDSCAQTYFFSLINQLKIKNSTNILQIACGAGLLLPFVIDQKKTETPYVATDLSLSMIKIAERRLRSNFEKYESKLSFEQWTKKHNLTLKEANGQFPVEGYGKFDTVICNLVLMLTINPQNILTSVYNTSTQNVLMGITIWGNQTYSVRALGLPYQKKKTPFDYLQKVHNDFKQTGWQVLFQWQQIAPYSLTSPDDIISYIGSLNQSLQVFNPDDKIRVKDKIKQVYTDIINTHTPMLMSSRLFIVKKSK